MILISTENELAELKTFDPVKLKCINCNNDYTLKLKDYKYNLKLGGNNGAFCNKNCFHQFRAKNSSFNTQCKECNKPISRCVHEKNQNDNYFCSSKCSAVYNNRNRKSTLINLECIFCKSIFQRQKGAKSNGFCSINCSYRFKNPIKINNKLKPFRTRPLRIKGGSTKYKRTETVKCMNCSSECKKSPYQIEHNKYIFCSRSCHASYGNKTFNKSSRFGINKSKAETTLVNIIKSDFPELIIIENDRKILDGLEIDVLIPSEKIAIELNGPCHYIPIFGEPELIRTKNKDIIKKQKLQELKLHFFQINIMGVKGDINNFLKPIYEQQIKPLITGYTGSAPVTLK